MFCLVDDFVSCSVHCPAFGSMVIYILVLTADTLPRCHVVSLMCSKGVFLIVCCATHLALYSWRISLLLWLPLSGLGRARVRTANCKIIILLDAKITL
jgi:hypothetical protein